MCSWRAPRAANAAGHCPPLDIECAWPRCRGLDGPGHRSDRHSGSPCRPGLRVRARQDVPATHPVLPPPCCPPPAGARPAAALVAARAAPRVPRLGGRRVAPAAPHAPRNGGGQAAEPALPLPALPGPLQRAHGGRLCVAAPAAPAGGRVGWVGRPGPRGSARATWRCLARRSLSTGLASVSPWVALPCRGGSCRCLRTRRALRGVLASPLPLPPPAPPSPAHTVLRARCAPTFCPQRSPCCWMSTSLSWRACTDWSSCLCEAAAASGGHWPLAAPRTRPPQQGPSALLLGCPRTCCTARGCMPPARFSPLPGPEQRSRLPCLPCAPSPPAAAWALPSWAASPAWPA